MSNTYAYRGYIATEPFVARGTGVKVEKGFASLEHRVKLTPLVVVFGSAVEGIEPGDTVWVNPDGEKSFGKQPVEVGEKKIIVFPVQHILLVTKKPDA